VVYGSGDPSTWVDSESGGWSTCEYGFGGWWVCDPSTMMIVARWLKHLNTCCLSTCGSVTPGVGDLSTMALVDGGSGGLKHLNTCESGSW